MIIYKCAYTLMLYFTGDRPSLFSFSVLFILPSLRKSHLLSTQDNNDTTEKITNVPHISGDLIMSLFFSPFLNAIFLFAL